MLTRFTIVLMMLLGMSPSVVAQPQFSARIADQGTPEVFLDGTRVLTAKFHFWAADWAYAWSEFEIGQRTDGVLPITGAAKTLGLTFAGTIDDRDPTAIRVSLECTAQRDLAGLIGGGLEFSLDHEAAKPARAGRPELLPASTGWSWPTALGPVSVSFERPLKECYYERGDERRIRCMFIGDSLRAGSHRFAYTLHLPESARVDAPIAERYAPLDRQTWRPDTMVWNAYPIDLSSLNDKPAGGRGPLRADRDRLLFEDGTEARFWGTNLQAYALFSGSDEQIARQAQRIAALGFNLVRIHHHDSRWVDPNVFGAAGNRTGLLNPEMLDRIDRWIAELKKQGVYVWLDLHVGREFLRAEAGPAADELGRRGGQAKGFNFVNPRLERLMNQFTLDYLSHRNRYTGLTYAEDPAVAFVLITNENDLTTHFGNLMLPDKNNPLHHAMFKAQVREAARTMGLSPADAMRTWEPGPSKLVMAGLEHAFYDRTIERLEAMRLAKPVAASNFWGGMGLHGLASLTRGDVIDAHSYGVEEALLTDPRHTADWIDWIACAQIENMPLTVSEWNVPYPTRDRFTAPLWLAGAASFQGWDALMHYGYLQDQVGPPRSVQPWSTWVDPSLMALMPAASLMFRERHVTPGASSTVFTPTREDVYFRNSTPDDMALLRAEPERTRFAVRLPDTPELAWDTPTPDRSANPVTDPDRHGMPTDAHTISTDNGQITRDWRAGVLTIDTSRSQAACGWIGGKRLELTDAVIESGTSAATIALTALDARPIAESSRILVTAVAQSAALADRPPMYAEPVRATVRVRTAIDVAVVTPLSPRGHRAAPIPASREGDWLVFELTGGEPGHWLLIEPANP
ncbi:MAG: cellulase family glycosylhydrolase [Phycisphaerales bacterium]